jgi:DNA-binding transcriptional MocR family regulator
MQRDVLLGRLRPGERLPTHRDLADRLGINVSTVTRAYREAERRGLLSATVGRGTFVTADPASGPAMMPPEPQAPGLLELGLITPLYELDPDLGDGLRRLSTRRDLASLLHYAAPAGPEDHRRAGAEWASRFGRRANPEEVVVCAGAQHALAVSLASLFRPGERIAVGGLVFPGMKSLAAMLGLRLAPLPMDAEGPTPEGLDLACRRDKVAGVYLIASLHNPTAAQASPARREALAATIRRHGLLLVEDDTFALASAVPGGQTRNEATPIAISQLVPEHSVYIAGVSKTLCAGLRTTFAVAGRELRGRLAEGVLNTVWMAPPIGGALFALWLKDGTAERVLRAKAAEAERRRRMALEMLEGFETASAPRGPFLWLSLPEPWTGAVFEHRARELGVNLFGAEKFAVGDWPPPAAARIALTSAGGEEPLRRALAVVRDILRGNAVAGRPVM